MFVCLTPTTYIPSHSMQSILLYPETRGKTQFILINGCMKTILLLYISSLWLRTFFFNAFNNNAMILTQNMPLSVEQMTCLKVLENLNYRWSCIFQPLSNLTTNCLASYIDSFFSLSYQLLPTTPWVIGVDPVEIDEWPGPVTVGT